MPRQTSSDKIEMLRRRQADIAAELKEAEAHEREKQRLEVQRREALAGRCMLRQIEEHPDSALSKSLIELLDGAITRKGERALFPALLTAASKVPETA